MTQVTCTVTTQRGFVIIIENEDPNDGDYALFESVTLTDSNGAMIDNISAHRDEGIGLIPVWVNLLNDPECDPRSTDWEDGTKGYMGFLG